MRMTPDQNCDLPNVSESQPAKMVPVMEAEKVPRPKMPLPHDSFFSGNNSGSIPYFVGPKIALCVLIKAMAANISRTFPSQNAEHDHRHDAQFGAFDGDGDAALAETVGEKSAGHRKQDKRHRKNGADQPHEAVALFVRQTQAEDEKRDQELQRVVAEGILEFDDEHQPETAKVSWRPASGVWDFGFHHAQSYSILRAGVN